MPGARSPGHPKRDVERAAEIERYLRDGAPAKPEPAANPLPQPFMEHAQRAPAVLLDVLSAIMAERERQIAKGYDAAHDDSHRDERMAYEAALAIAPEQIDLSSFHGEDGTAVGDWIDITQPRAKVLLQGVALAVAEMERWNRAYLAKHGDFINNVPPAADTSTLPPTGIAAASGIPPYRQPVPSEPEPAAHPAPVEADHDDYGNIAHALGRPTHPLNQTYRNRFVVDADSTTASRLALFPGIWKSRPYGHAKGMALFYVRDAGRHALADYMDLFPGAIRDTVDNSKEPAYVPEPAEEVAPDTPGDATTPE